MAGGGLASPFPAGRGGEGVAKLRVVLFFLVWMPGQVRFWPRCGLWLWLALASWWWQSLLVVEKLRRLLDLSGASLRWFSGDMSAVAPDS
jgi:hypothetical protein